MDLHRHIERASDALYTQADVLKYIMFGKQFKPVLSPEAGELLVKHYVQLRQREGPNAAKSMYRITVRQLESMIRLSEAQAKMECTETVHLILRFLYRKFIFIVVFRFCHDM
jgi:DNA replication licensing factor MCM6